MAQPLLVFSRVFISVNDSNFKGGDIFSFSKMEPSPRSNWKFEITFHSELDDVVTLHYNHMLFILKKYLDLYDRYSTKGGADIRFYFNVTFQILSTRFL